MLTHPSADCIMLCMLTISDKRVLIKCSLTIKPPYMIPTFIYLLLRRYGRTHPEKAKRLTTIFKKASRLMLLFILLLLMSLFALPQQTRLEYNIKRNGSTIGTLCFSQRLSGNKTLLKLESLIKTRFIFIITAKALEEAEYENGIMNWSTVHQKINGSDRINKKINLMGRKYVVTKGNQTETITGYPILFNMICLYMKEPTGISKIYSDNFQRLLDIHKLDDHHYKINFPDGNYNEYYYNNGLCTKVNVHHSIYRSSFELKTTP